MFDNDFFRRDDIEELKKHNKSLSSRVIDSNILSKELQTRVRQLEEDLASLALFNQTLLRMVIEKEVCEAQEFINLLKMIDLEDGVADGKITPQRELDNPDCPECARRLPKGKNRCMYCGHTVTN